MQKKHSIIYLCILMLLVSACGKTVSEPQRTIEFEIEEKGLAENEYARVIVNIQKRLESLGAKNVTIDNQVEGKLSYSYQGDISPETLEQSFAITGKIEFFETASPKMAIQNYLMYGNDSNKLSMDEKEEKLIKNKAFNSFMEIVRLANFNSEDGIIGYVSKKDKARMEALSIYKESFYVTAIKKRVKLLLGKPDDNEQYTLRAVFVSAEDKAPLDGTYITNTTVEKSNYNDTYLINIQKNEEGALLWERLTETVHQQRSFIAVVIDDFVYCAPGVMNGKITGGISQISANFTKDEASRLASVIASGSIPKIKITKMPVMEDSFPSN